MQVGAGVMKTLSILSVPAHAPALALSAVYAHIMQVDPGVGQGVATSPLAFSAAPVTVAARSMQGGRTSSGELDGASSHVATAVLIPSVRRRVSCIESSMHSFASHVE